MRDAVLTGILAFFGAFLGVPMAYALQTFVLRRRFERTLQSLTVPKGFANESPMPSGPSTSHDDTPTPNERRGL